MVWTLTLYTRCTRRVQTSSDGLDEPPAFREIRVGARGAVETARPSLSVLHLRDADVDAPFACLRVWRCVDPANPFPARHRRDVVPHPLDLLRGSGKRRGEILRHVRLGPVITWHHRNCRCLARAHSRAALELPVDPHPVPTLAVWFQHRLECMAVDGPPNRHLAARRQHPAGLRGQAQQSPFVQRVRRCIKLNCLRRRRFGCSGHIRLFCGSRTLASAPRQIKATRRRDTPLRPRRGTAVPSSPSPAGDVRDECQR